MHGFDAAPVKESGDNSDGRPWYSLLTKYHWFVLIVAALGWLFDTMDQQLFNLARVPAMQDLVPASQVAEFGGYATSIFLIGWATGGLFFGILGDKIGRAKTMMFTILIYSLCTGLSALSVGFWDFAFYRFLTGLGVGGEFAVGVALVAEVMPDRARPFALGLLQALSAIGNITAAAIGFWLSSLEASGAVGDAWRVMFVIGTLPALLAIVIRRRLKEPERWQAAVGEATTTKVAGSYAELFGDPRWRKRAIVGMLLAFSGVVGLWGIGFFSIDLNRSVFRKTFQQELREQGHAEQDREFVRMAFQSPEAIEKLSVKIEPSQILAPTPADNTAAIFEAVRAMSKPDSPLTRDEVLERHKDYLSGPELVFDAAAFDAHASRISTRSKELDGRLLKWASITSMMLNLAAFFGIYAYSYVSHAMGRRPAFAIGFVAAMLSTAMVFWFLDDLTDVFWMIPIMGFCQLYLFGGYAVYFPELFPTRLRSTGTSFCYNVGRFVAASGPSVLGLLTSRVFTVEAGYYEPMRYAGVTMCSVFLIGLLVLPFAPETRGLPLPE